MGITDRVEQLHRVLEAMNAWYATNGDDPPEATGAVAGDGPPAGTVPGSRPAAPADSPPTETVPPAAPAAPADSPRAGTAPAASADEAHPEPQPLPLPPLVDDLLPKRRAGATPLESAAEVAESLGLGYHLGSAVERIASASQQGSAGTAPLREAVWLIERYLALLERRPVGADLHASTARLARTGEAIAGLRALSAALESESTAEPTAKTEASTKPAPPAMPEPAEAPSPAADDDEPSLWHEIAFMAARWTIMVIAVIAVVLAVTVIGQWF